MICTALLHSRGSQMVSIAVRNGEFFACVLILRLAVSIANTGEQLFLQHICYHPS